MFNVKSEVKNLTEGGNPCIPGTKIAIGTVEI